MATKPTIKDLFSGKFATPIQALSILSKTKGVKKLQAVNALVDGAVGLILMDDGHQYEIVIRPAEYGRFQGLYKNFIKKE